MSRLTRYEQETIINFNEGEDTASVYTHNKTLRRKLEQLAQERPGECRLFKTCHDGQAVEYYIPKKWLKIRPAQILSDERRAELAENARKRLLGRSAPVITGDGALAEAEPGKDTPQPSDGKKEA